VNKERRISLYRGDLSRIPSDQTVDLLVVSAFPNNYVPVPDTLIGALHRRGLSVAERASDKAQDLREISGFRISKPLVERYPDLHIGRIACFEPLVIGQPPQVVGELFRGLFPLLDESEDAIVAMPLLSSDNQRWPPEAIFGPLAEAAYHWLQRGLPIAELRIVETREGRVRTVARQLDEFRDGRFAAGAVPEPPAVPPEPDDRTILPPAALPPSERPARPTPPPEEKQPGPADVPPQPAEPAGPAQPPGGGCDVFLSYAE
jgi:hypothetical protein